jgi:hypothetical protein
MADTLNMVLFTLSLMIGTAGLPHVIIRFFTVPKVVRRALVGRLGAGLHRAALHHRSGRRRHGASEHHGLTIQRHRSARRQPCL